MSGPVIKTDGKKWLQDPFSQVLALEQMNWMEAVDCNPDELKTKYTDFKRRYEEATTDFEKVFYKSYFCRF